MRFFILVVLIAIVVIGAMFATGVMSFTNTPDESRITIDKSRFKQQADETWAKTREAKDEGTERLARALRHAGESLQADADKTNAEKAKSESEKAGKDTPHDVERPVAPPIESPKTEPPSPDRQWPRDDGSDRRT
jgi:hypothetical protein